jgi:hypothetical protein
MNSVWPKDGRTSLRTIGGQETACTDDVDAEETVTVCSGRTPLNARLAKTTTTKIILDKNRMVLRDNKK